MTRKQYRLTRRLMVVLAAAPLLQLSQCKTGTSQTLAYVGNGLPSTIFSLLESLALAPLYSLLGGGSLGSSVFGNSTNFGGGF